MTRTYDAYGNVISQKSRSFRQDGSTTDVMRGMRQDVCRM